MNKRGMRDDLFQGCPGKRLAAAIRTIAAGGRSAPSSIAAATGEIGRYLLTDPKHAVLRLAEEGLSIKDIANWLGLSAGGVHNYPSSAVRKVNAARRNAVERYFCELNHLRRVATRFDEFARNFLAAVMLASTRIRPIGFALAGAKRSLRRHR